MEAAIAVELQVCSEVEVAIVVELQVCCGVEAAIAVELQVCLRHEFRVCTFRSLIEGSSWTVFMFTEKRCGNWCGGAAKVFQHRMLKVQRHNPVTCLHIVIRAIVGICSSAILIVMRARNF